MHLHGWIDDTFQAEIRPEGQSSLFFIVGVSFCVSVDDHRSINECNTANISIRTVIFYFE